MRRYLKSAVYPFRARATAALKTAPKHHATWLQNHTALGSIFDRVELRSFSPFASRITYHSLVRRSSTGLVIPIMRLHLF